MGKTTRDRRFQFSLRTMFWCVTIIAVFVFLCSGGFERIFFPTTVYSKDSFSPKEVATLTARVSVKLPPNARVFLATYDKHFGPGGADITIGVKMPTEEASEFLESLKQEGALAELIYHPLTCPIPEWREARRTLEMLYRTPDAWVYLSKPVDGSTCVYYEFEDRDGQCSKIIGKGKWRRALLRERSN